MPRQRNTWTVYVKKDAKTCGASRIGVVGAAVVLFVATCLAPPGASADPLSSDPGIVDASSAPTEAQASAIAVQFGHAVVADADTTDSSEVSAEPDGSFELSESDQPVRVHQAGAWIPVDTDLSMSDGMLVPDASAVPVEFSAGGSGPLAKIQAADGSWLSESWPAGSLPTPSVSGNSATYADVFSGVDLQLTATATGLSSVLVVHNAAAASDPQLDAVRFGVSGTSVSAVAGTGGSGDVAAAQTTNGLVAASPSWWDSSQHGTTSSAPGGLGISEPVSESVSASALTLNVAAAAQTSGVTFPVYVDPDWTGGVQERTFTDSAYPTKGYWNGSGASDSYQHVGHVQASWSDDGLAHTTHSFWQMSLSGVQNTKITAATFNTDEIYASSCNKREVDLYTTGAISSSTTWNSKTTFDTKLDSQTVAYGYSSACPSHSVGFDATAGVSTAVNAGHSNITLGLKAADESDTDSWKKFEAKTTLTITYDHYPSVPASLSVGGCSFVCSSPAYTRDSTPALTAKSSDADGGNLSYTFEIIQGQSASVAAPYYRTGAVSNVPENTIATYSPSALPAGAYEYRVYVTDGTASASADSALFRFTVDTTAPAAPKVTLSGGLSTDAAAPSGNVGVTTESITISPGSSADDAWGYAYAITPDAASVVFPANLACNTQIAGYTTVCPGLNASTLVTITAPDDTSSFAAVTFDAAGNSHGPASSTATFYALPDTASMSAGHSWTTDTAGSSTSCPGSGQVGPVPDSASTGGQGLTLSGTACWGYDGSAPNPTGGLGGGVLSFAGTATTPDAVTGSAVLNTTKAYTVAAWVYPTTTGTAYYDVMAQNGTDESAFVLQESSGARWSFCVTSSDAATWAGHCADSTSIASGQWAFLVGQYNPTDHTVTLRVSNPVTQGNPLPQGLQTPILNSQAGSFAASGPLQIGGGRIGTADRPWVGEVADPVAVQGIADTGQLQQLMSMTAPSNVTFTGGQ